VWEEERSRYGHRFGCKTVQEVANRYGTKHSQGGSREPTRWVISVSSIEEDIVQLTGILWFQIPFKDLHLYAAKMPDML
jgi:hypothetical protein